MSDQEIVEYLSPWTERRVARSWMALAGVADSTYTLELMDHLRRSPIPKLLVWGEDDTFQPIEYAERLAQEMPHTELVKVQAGHIPMESHPASVAEALVRFRSA